MENTQAKFIYAELFGVASGSRLKSEIYVCYESLNNDHVVGYYSRRDVSHKEGSSCLFYCQRNNKNTP